MIDPLAEIVLLLQSSALFSKTVVGAGPWRTMPSDTREPFYGVIFEGGCRLTVNRQETIHCEASDFVLLPVAHHLQVTSRESPARSGASAPAAIGS